MDSLTPFVPVIAAAVTGLLGILGGFIAWVLKRIEDVHKNTSAANEQVSNSHKTNLRDDIDALHDDVRQLLKISVQQGGQIEDIRKDVRRHEERLDDLEPAKAA